MPTHPRAAARPAAPRVVIAHDYLTQKGGAERVVLAMLEAFPDARVVTTMYNPSTTFPEFRRHRVESLWPGRLKVLRDDPRRALPVLARAVSRHRIDDADVVLASSSGWAHGFPTDAPKIVYCHNPARWLHVAEDYLPNVPPHARLALRALEPRLLEWDRAAARTATRYLANSTVVQRRVRRAYGIEAGLLHPPTGIDPDGAQQPVPGVEPGFLLTVARARCYKNTRVVCEAVAAMPHVRLVVVGGAAEPGEPTPSNILRLRDLTDAQLRWLYAHAAGLVGVSHEDFGLTPVEAYSFGVPSVLLRAGGYLDSSVEGLTTVFVDAVDADELRAGIETLLATAWQPAAIRRHADKFSAASFGAALHQEVRRVLPVPALSDAAIVRPRTEPVVASLEHA
ncbi:glycosyltransferase [Nocardioides ferulae]|uniref:glycosyltransferase n=1 Tax=Nocardioides ferulae TaxID=2340821 RepID=UPI000EAF9C5C|nr:glycosyltransferase [Nocardioides ferulae]